ncbi:MAG: fibrobacter succinogenes major paralogous domain-containing protein [Fibrobacter sp.]|nr:fibrobacter succinogenes major paralogous domain-containing protein [Fibrobacter sp.]
MSIESDAAKWKSNVSRILEIDSEGILLTVAVKNYFDEVASVFKKGTFDAENTKKQLRALRARNTRLSGKPIAVELSSFINITERYATKTEEAFTSFVKALSSNARLSSNGNSTRTSSRQHQAQSSRQKPLPDPPDALDSIISELDNLADESPSRTPPPPRISTILRSRLNSLASIENYQRVERVAIENPFANEVVEKKSRLPWIIGMILLLLGIFFVSIHLNENVNYSEFAPEKMKNNSNVVKGTLIDSRDGKKYKIVKIGRQVWMAENLNYKMKNTYCYNNSADSCAKYGRLYIWDAAVGACPDGWHLPTMAEFSVLFSTVGGSSSAGRALKSAFDWEDDGNGSDAFGFSAVPAGYRNNDGKYSRKGAGAYFWSAIKEDIFFANFVRLYYYSNDVYMASDSKASAFSVRCVRD